MSEVSGENRRVIEIFSIGATFLILLYFMLQADYSGDIFSNDIPITTEAEELLEEAKSRHVLAHYDHKNGVCIVTGGPHIGLIQFKNIATLDIRRVCWACGDNLPIL